MNKLSKKPTLGELQEYIKLVGNERGFQDTSIPELFMYLSEEVGEVAKAARQLTKMHVDDSSEKKELAHELADVLSYLLDIANHFNVDLETAFREKEEINNRRTWGKKGE